MQNTSSPPLGWEFRPAYYYQLAAQYLKEKKTCVEITLAMPDSIPESDDNSDSIVASLYIGQFVRLLELGDTSVMQLYVFPNKFNFFLPYYIFSLHRQNTIFYSIFFNTFLLQFSNIVLSFISIATFYFLIIAMSSKYDDNYKAFFYLGRFFKV